MLLLGVLVAGAGAFDLKPVYHLTRAAGEMNGESLWPSSSPRAVLNH